MTWIQNATAYDPIGNRQSYQLDGGTATTYTTNNLNQYTATANPTEYFCYDADGNLIADGKPTSDCNTANGAWAYTWDGENRLIRVEPAATPTSGDKKLEFQYDYRSRRVRKTSYTHNGSAWIEDADLLFVYDDWNVVLVLDANDDNEVTHKHTWGLDLSGLSGNASVSGIHACPGQPSADPPAGLIGGDGRLSGQGANNGPIEGLAAPGGPQHGLHRSARGQFDAERRLKQSLNPAMRPAGIFVKLHNGGLLVRPPLRGRRSQDVEGLQFMSALHAPAAAGALADVNVELPVNGPGRNLDLVLMDDVHFMQATAAIQALRRQRSVMHLVNLPRRRDRTARRRAVVRPRLAPRRPGRGLGFTLGEGGGLAFGRAPGLFKQVGQMLTAGFLVGRAGFELRDALVQPSNLTMKFGAGRFSHPGRSRRPIRSPPRDGDGLLIDTKGAIPQARTTR